MIDAPTRAIVTGMPPSWDNWLELLYHLRRDRTGSYERPHKPVFLLSIMDLLDRGLLGENAVPLNDQLIDTFKRYFEVVRRHNDRPNIQNPFFHLSGDNFWTLIPRPGHMPIYCQGSVSRAPGIRQLQKTVLHGQFDSGLWKLLKFGPSRQQLREALIARYFPEDRERLASLSTTGSEPPGSDASDEALVKRRSGAFRRTILDIYDYRCAACGMRVIIDHQLSLVEAAHLIPFEVSRDDRPSNGLALCPNHHWAMDRNLIAPCPDSTHKSGVWKVNTQLLDNRIDGQRDLVALNKRKVIAPKDRRFLPAPNALRWREERLQETPVNLQLASADPVAASPHDE